MELVTTCPTCKGSGDIKDPHEPEYCIDCPTCDGEGKLECLDRHDEKCTGEVELRWPLSATGRSFPRCDFHWDKRLEEQEKINKRYPQNPPSDFSYLDAGEYWEED